MTIPDVNVLVHAYDSEFPHHAAVKKWWEETLNGEETVGLPWTSVLGFIRLVTSRSVFRRPFSVHAAVEIVRDWLAQEVTQSIVPGPKHGEFLFKMLEQLGVAGNLTTDAHIAALALEYRAVVATTDSDFARFRGVRCYNPVSRKKS